MDGGYLLRLLSRYAIQLYQRVGCPVSDYRGNSRIMEVDVKVEEVKGESWKDTLLHTIAKVKGWEAQDG